MVDYSKATFNKYFPNKSPNKYEEGFISDELSKISFAIDQVSMGHLDVQNVAPDKPRQALPQHMARPGARTHTTEPKTLG